MSDNRTESIVCYNNMNQKAENPNFLSVFYMTVKEK